MPFAAADGQHKLPFHWAASAEPEPLRRRGGRRGDAGGGNADAAMCMLYPAMREMGEMREMAGPAVSGVALATGASAIADRALYASEYALKDDLFQIERMRERYEIPGRVQRVRRVARPAVYACVVMTTFVQHAARWIPGGARPVGAVRRYGAYRHRHTQSWRLLSTQRDPSTRSHRPRPRPRPRRGAGAGGAGVAGANACRRETPMAARKGLGKGGLTAAVVATPNP